MNAYITKYSNNYYRAWIAELFQSTSLPNEKLEGRAFLENIKLQLPSKKGIKTVANFAKNGKNHEEYPMLDWREY